MHPFRLHGLTGLLLLLAPAWASAQITTSQAQLLKDAEIRRGVLFSTGIQWTVQASSQGGKTDSNATMIVRAQSGKALAEIIQPSTSAGKKYLLSNGEMWFHRPGVKRAVVVPRRQQVAGDAAIGDIASISFLLEYKPTSARSATLNGENCTVIELSARPEARASYSKIHLWISNSDRVSRQAQFYTKTGRHIRTATFQHKSKVKVGGKTIPFLSQLDVTELLGTPKRTTLKFRDYKIVPTFPGSMFDKNSLPNLP